MGRRIKLGLTAIDKMEWTDPYDKTKKYCTCSELKKELFGDINNLDYADSINKIMQDICICGHKKERHDYLSNHIFLCYDKNCLCEKFEVSQHLAEKSPDIKFCMHTGSCDEECEKFEVKE